LATVRHLETSSIDDALDALDLLVSSKTCYDHINFLGRYAFTRAESGTGLRPFHDPTQEP
jgi:hypothetical protein